MQLEEYPKIYLYKRIVQAKLFIDANYSEGLDLTNISNEACFSKFHFIRIFKKIYGKTPHQYLTRVRIAAAVNLIQAGKSVSEACFAVGFVSMTSFSGLFKRTMGISPSGCLTQQRQLQSDLQKTPMAFVPICFAHQFGWIKQSNFEEDYH